MSTLHTSINHITIQWGEKMAASKGTLHRNNGFTLIELMIVVVVIMVLLAIAIPSIRKQSGNHRKNSPTVAKKVDDSRITPEMLRQQKEETAMVLQAVQAELQDELQDEH